MKLYGRKSSKPNWPASKRISRSARYNRLGLTSGVVQQKNISNASAEPPIQVEKPSLGRNFLHSQRIQRQVAATKSQTGHPSPRNEQNDKDQQRFTQPQGEIPTKTPLFQPTSASNKSSNKPNNPTTPESAVNPTTLETKADFNKVRGNVREASDARARFQDSSMPESKVTSLQVNSVEADSGNQSRNPKPKAEKKEKRVSWKLIPEIRQIPKRVVSRRSRGNRQSKGTGKSLSVPEVEAHLLQNIEEAGVENFEVSAVHSLQSWRKARQPSCSKDNQSSFLSQSHALTQGTPPNGVVSAEDENDTYDVVEEQSSFSSSHDTGKSFFDKITYFLSAQFQKPPDMSDMCNSATKTLSNHLKEQEHCFDFELEIETPELSQFQSSTTETIVQKDADDDSNGTPVPLEPSFAGSCASSSVSKSLSETQGSETVTQQSYSTQFMSEVYGKATEALTIPFHHQLPTNHQWSEPSVDGVESPQLYSSSPELEVPSPGLKTSEPAFAENVIKSDTDDILMPDNESCEVSLEGFDDKSRDLLDHSSEAELTIKGSKLWGLFPRRKQKDRNSNNLVVETLESGIIQQSADATRRSRSLFSRRKKSMPDSLDQSSLRGQIEIQGSYDCSSINTSVASQEVTDKKSKQLDEEATSAKEKKSEIIKAEDEMHTFANLFVNAWEYTPFSFPWNDEEMKAMHHSEEVCFENESLPDSSSAEHHQTKNNQFPETPERIFNIRGKGQLPQQDELSGTKRIGDVITSGPCRGAQLVVSIHQDQYNHEGEEEEEEGEGEAKCSPYMHGGNTTTPVSATNLSICEKAEHDAHMENHLIADFDCSLDATVSRKCNESRTNEVPCTRSTSIFSFDEIDQPSDEEEVDRRRRSETVMKTSLQSSFNSVGDKKPQIFEPSKNSAFQSKAKITYKSSSGRNFVDRKAKSQQSSSLEIRKRGRHTQNYERLDISFSGESYESLRWEDGNMKQYRVESIDSASSYTQSLISDTDASASQGFETEEEAVATDEYETEDEGSGTDGNDTEEEGNVTEGFQTDDEQEEIIFSLRSDSENHNDAKNENVFPIFKLNDFVGFTWGHQNETEEVVFESESESESSESEWSESYITSQDDDDYYTSQDDEEREDIGQHASYYCDALEERETGGILDNRIDSKPSEASTHASSDRGSSAMEDSTVGWDNTTTFLSQKNPQPQHRTSHDIQNHHPRKTTRYQTQNQPTFYSISTKARMVPYASKKQQPMHAVKM